MAQRLTKRDLLERIKDAPDDAPVVIGRDVGCFGLWEAEAEYVEPDDDRDLLPRGWIVISDGTEIGEAAVIVEERARIRSRLANNLDRGWLRKFDL